MIETFYISERFFSKDEIEIFYKNFGYQIKEILYSSTGDEIDFSSKSEKDFLLKYGTPKILARFGY